MILYAYCVYFNNKTRQCVCDCVCVIVCVCDCVCVIVCVYVIVCVIVCVIV